jgi:hypothetical protein
MNTTQLTEYEVRYLDCHGDVIDVCHYQTRAEATRDAKTVEFENEIKAVVLEKHTTYFACLAHDRSDKYTRLLTLGDQNALKEGNWI